MSVIRENWSALSTLAQLWTVEDEEEVERERRRKTRSFTSTIPPGNSSSDDIEPHTISEGSDPEDIDNDGRGMEQLQMDFVEMLRMRDERRRTRHVETLNKQRQEEEGMHELRSDRDNAREPEVDSLMEPDDEKKEAPNSSSSVSSTDIRASKRNKQGEDRNANQPMKPTESSKKFVSSLSISLDKTPVSPDVTSRLTSPLRARSPSPEIFGAMATVSPTNSFSENSTQNEDSKECQSGLASNFEPADKPAFTRQSSRTMSFRILRKKEEESMPLQRSASVRIKEKKYEHNSKSNEERQKSSFPKHRQRLSSHSIQEKMERLALASQKWEAIKSPSLVHKTLFMAEEVSRKRDLFEKEQATPESCSKSNKQEYRTLSAGISDRISRWVEKKTLQSLSSLTPADLRHVNISSKKMLFEKGKEEESHQTVHK